METRRYYLRYPDVAITANVGEEHYFEGRTVFVDPAGKLFIKVYPSDDFWDKAVSFDTGILYTNISQLNLLKSDNNTVGQYIR